MTSKTLSFRCSVEEYDALAQAAEQANKSLGVFVKDVALNSISSGDLIPVADEDVFSVADQKSVARAVWALFKLRAVELGREGRQQDIDTAVELAKDKFR